MKISSKTGILCALAVMSVMSGAAAVKSLDKGAADNGPLPAEVNAADDVPEFYLRECEGYIAVFAGKSSDTPLRITDIETVTLTDTDRALLRNGIAAGDKTQLLKLLEDLSS